MNRIGQFRVIVVALVAGLIGGACSSQLLARFTAGSRSDRVVTAEEFRVVDKGGRVRARLTVLPFGAGLAIYSADQRARRTWLGGSGLSISGKGESAILLGVSENSLLSDASISLVGRDGKSRVSLSANSGKDAMGGGARLRLGREVSEIVLGCPYNGTPVLEVQHGGRAQGLSASNVVSNNSSVHAQAAVNSSRQRSATAPRKYANVVRMQIPLRVSRRSSRMSAESVSQTLNQSLAQGSSPTSLTTDDAMIATDHLPVSGTRDGGGIVGDREHTCVGATPCTACRNCKYCKHCGKNGGKCGFCKG